MMKILITGDRGFIGKHLVKGLKQDEFWDDGFWRVQGLDIKRHFWDEDIRRQVCMKVEFFKQYRPDVVIHLAALTGVRNSLRRPQDYFSTNVWGTYNLLNLAKKYKVKQFLFASSSSVYGTHQCPLKESMECNHQLSPYAVSKKAGEMLCRMFSDLRTVVFRPFTVYGENGRKDQVIRKLIKAGRTGKTFYRYGDGSSSRGYTNVHDLVEGIIKLIEYKPKGNFEIFNLGGAEEIKLNYLIAQVKKYYPKLKVEQQERKTVDPLHSLADISKARKKLGWCPTRKFKNEIKNLCTEKKKRS